MVNELLAPAGSLEALKIAINAGADAVYCAGKRFGARAYAHNLSNEEIIEGSKYCHLYGKKIYITLNTYVFEEEMKEVEEYIDFLYQYVDALIVQDYGVIHYIRSKYPDFPVHISTQNSVHNIQDIKFLKSIGVSRVVLAREVPLEEIKEMNKEGLELEIFIHGALCFSYSGLCYLSYYKGGRSGNRGTCAQPCRMNYELLEDGNKIKEGPLLSMKDLNTTKNIKDILSSGVTSLKIEGRMKSLEYIYSVTRIYRQLIDDFNNGKEIKINNELLSNLYASYSRERTSGYLLNSSNKDVTTDVLVKHQGILIGEVIDYKKGQIKIKLNKELDLLDGLRFVYKDKESGLTVTRIIENGSMVKRSSGIIYIDVKERIEIGSKVYKTSSNKVSKELKNYKNIKNNEAKLEILLARNKQIISIEVGDYKANKIYNHTLPKANNINDDKLIEVFKKTNNLPISYTSINFINKEGLYISIPEINKMRGEILLEIKEYLQNRKERNNLFYPFVFDNNEVKTKEMDDLIIENKKDDFTLINNKVLNKKEMAYHLAEISPTSVISPYFGVNNMHAVHFFRNMSNGVIVLSYESSYQNALFLSKRDKNLGYLIDFYQPLMISKHCPVAKAKGYEYKGCKECEKHRYQLKDNDFIYELKFNHCVMQIVGKEVKRNKVADLVNVIYK